MSAERICKRCYRMDDGCADCGGTGTLPERRSSPRVRVPYTPEEDAAFERRVRDVLADPYYSSDDEVADALAADREAQADLDDEDAGDPRGLRRRRQLNRASLPPGASVLQSVLRDAYRETRRANERAIVEYPEPCLFCRAGIVILGRPEWRCWQHGGFR